MPVFRAVNIKETVVGAKILALRVILLIIFVPTRFVLLDLIAREMVIHTRVTL